MLHVCALSSHTPSVEFAAYAWPNSTLAVWPCIVAWSRGSLVCTMRSCWVPMPQNSMYAAANPCMVTAAINNQANNMRNMSVVD